MATTAAIPEQLIYLIIRFTTSIPDRPLAIHSPSVTTTLTLKRLIRPHLPFNQRSARLRLIYAGKVLSDATPLSTSLRLPPPPPPPPRDGTYNEYGPGHKGKGKEPVQSSAPESVGADIPPDARKYYIHCSLGDALSPSELASEADDAQTTETLLRSQFLSGSTQLPRDNTVASRDGARGRRSSASSAAAPEPQGFDRLLSSGFTPQEVASLRSHFQTNLSYTHTPDTMPSATEMRALEDRWLDSTATDPSPGMTGEGGEAGWGAGFAVEEGGLDDMLWGYLTGFFWPLGGLVWGFREEGIWPRRRQLAVAMGVLLNAAFGFMRWSQ